MTTTFAIKKQYGQQKDRYLELIEQFPLKPIRSDDELDVALELIHELITQDNLSMAEKDYLEVLTDLAETYEDSLMPISQATDSDVLSMLMDCRELTQSQFAKAVGIPTSTVSKVICGKRDLTRKQLEKVASYFHVSMDCFPASRS
jgi:HTH-type transcriptional regulator/antitoxin HigA